MRRDEIPATTKQKKTPGQKPRHGFSLLLKLMMSYALLILFPFCSMACLLCSAAEKNIHANTVTYVNMFVEQVSSGIDLFAEELDRMTKIMALDEYLPDILESEADSPAASYESIRYLDDYLLKLMTQQPGIKCVTMIGRNGKNYTCGSNKVQDLALFASKIGLNQLMENKYGLRFSGTHIPDYLLIGSTQPVFCVTRNLFLYNRYIGTIILHFDQSRFLDLIHVTPSVNEIDARIIVTNSENEVLLDTEADMALALAENDGPLHFEPSSDEMGENLCYTNRSRYSGLTTTILINREHTFQNINTFRIDTMTLTILLVVAMLVLSIFFAIRLVKPIKVLRRATEEYAKGNYDVRVYATSRDEIGGLCTSFNEMADHLKELMNRVYLYRLETETAQLKALQSQINPHFLHNTLETIRMKALINGDREVANMIKMLAKLFRITLDRKKNIVTLSEEIEHVQTYVELQNMRFNHRFKLDIRVEPGLESVYLMKLILQPLVENCIVHGFRNKYEDETISIMVEEASGDIRITVSDNGEGIEAERLKQLQIYSAAAEVSLEGREEHSGIGIVNIMSRIRLEYGSAYGLAIDHNMPRGTRVTIKLPMHKSLYEEHQ